MASTPSRPQRLQRISKACDFCHKRRIKCQDNPIDTSGRCRNCAEFDIPCTYARPSRRGRGSPQLLRPSSSSAAQAPMPIGLGQGPGQGSGQGPGQGLGDIHSIPHRQPGPERSHNPDHHPQSNSAGAAIMSPPSGRVTMSEHTASTDDGGYMGNERLSSTWQAFAHTSTPSLKRLATVFHETVFPIFPFFDPVRLQRRLDLLEHVSNRAFFCSVMAGCALATARARDGALSSTPSGGGSHPINSNGGLVSSASAAGSAVSGMTMDIPPEMFYAAAENALPKDILQCRDFDYLRALALLSIASIQDAKIAVMQKYIGHYFTLVAINQWHDEANWPSGLQATEIEERRRLYWSIYTLDVFTSIIWDGCIHFQESHAKVEYPTGLTELQQQKIQHRQQQQQEGGGGPPVENPASPPGSSDPVSSPSAPFPPSWMVGWNFTTDLYRILEHNLNKLRSRSSKFNLLGETATPGSFRVSSQDRVAELYAALPPIFKTIEPATGDPAHDIFGFQAANIQATMALLEMVHLSLEVDVDLERKCSVVHNVLQTFHQVPKAYMRAISTPLIYHIGGIGVILGSVMEGPLSEKAYRLVRDLLLSMAVLLESLEAFLHRSAGAGQRLRTLVARLEAYYASMRNQNRDEDIGAEGSNGYSMSSDASNSSSSSNNNHGQGFPPALSNNAMPHALPTIQSPTLARARQPPQLQPIGEGRGRVPAVSPPLGAASHNNGATMAFAQPQHQYQPHPQHQPQQPLPPLQPQPHQHQEPLSSPNAVTAAAASMYDPQQHQHQLNTVGLGAPQPNATALHDMGPQGPIGPGGPDPMATSVDGPALPQDINMQFQLPDEFLQDWTWPFAVSNNYLSF